MGHLIRTFGDFVVGGNYLIGVIIFLILVVMQFIVITKGSERVAEVGARFTLGCYAGKQMSIDADYNAGLITEDEARGRRKKVSMKKRTFMESMDGASKFVKGDAIAGIIIVIVNIIGGLIVGASERRTSCKTQQQTYVILTIGDGLVCSNTCTVDISSNRYDCYKKCYQNQDFGTDLINQFFQEPKSYVHSFW
jgi:flagellar biosynthesis protein FlhA